MIKYASFVVLTNSVGCVALPALAAAAEFDAEFPVPRFSAEERAKDATRSVVSQDLPDLPDFLSPKNVPDRQRAPERADSLPIVLDPFPVVPPETFTRKAVGWVSVGVGVLTAGFAGLALKKGWTTNETPDTTDLGVAETFLILQGATVSGLLGVGLLTGAYADDAAFDSSREKSDFGFQTDSYFKAARYAAVTGLATIGTAVGVFLLSWAAARTTSDEGVYQYLIVREVYLIEVGIGSELIALVCYDIGHGMKKQLGLRSILDGRFGFSLTPTNGSVDLRFGASF